ncbi:MAG TPA: hypothetical protein ENN39_00065 [Desulfonatronum sp.]|nr:hypothetical protein [Desulfonatronum sp.]
MQTNLPTENTTTDRKIPMDLPEFKINRAEERTVTWSVPWSDLMMVMFILFLVLFVFSLREKDRILPGHRTPASVSMSMGGQERLSMQPLFELIRERLIGYERYLNVAFLDDSSIVISLVGANFFEPASARISDQSRPVVSKIGQLVSLAQGKVVITGFAEDHAASDANAASKGAWETAAVRAAAIAEHLVQETGLNTHLLVIQASGANLPLSPYLLDPDNQRQRWAEIRILPSSIPAG